jgi:DNA primase
VREGKYLVRADITADGVVERSDVVGAVFGQTEGLLGDELDFRDLQDSSKLGRIDVEVESEGGRSYGQITIASDLDRAETAVLAAALETIERVGPCTATVEVRRIEDVRAAKRREVVERAKELVATAFDEGAFTGDDLVEEVRESARAAEIVEYEGLPAGPRVPEGDGAVIVVEGRADALTLLEYGVKNAVAVEGTNVPEAVADLTRERTTTAFLDGDRGGDLILRELRQVGDVDYVARAPAGDAVEDLSREAVFRALREKVRAGDHTPVGADTDTAGDEDDGEAAVEPAENGADDSGAADADGPESSDDSGAADADASDTVPGHAAAVTDSGRARLLGADAGLLAEAPADEAATLLGDAERPAALLLDATVSQAVLDEAARFGVERVVGAERGDWVKQPADVQVHTLEEVTHAGAETEAGVGS